MESYPATKYEIQKNEQLLSVSIQRSNKRIKKVMDKCEAKTLDSN